MSFLVDTSALVLYPTNYMILKFKTNSGVACLGTFLPINKADLKRYVHLYELHWVTV